jgi:hypothetical protein
VGFFAEKGFSHIPDHLSVFCPNGTPETSQVPQREIAESNILIASGERS